MRRNTVCVMRPLPLLAKMWCVSGNFKVTYYEKGRFNTLQYFLSVFIMYVQSKNKHFIPLDDPWLFSTGMANWIDNAPIFVAFFAAEGAAAHADMKEQTQLQIQSSYHTL